MLSLNKDTRGILAFGTDGEEELYRAMRFSFPHAIHLRCFTHFRDNCKEQLKSSRVPDEAQKEILTDIFGRRVGDTLEKGTCLGTGHKVRVLGGWRVLQNSTIKSGTPPKSVRKYLLPPLKGDEMFRYIRYNFGYINRTRRS
jgi:hypothetical protein